MLDRYKTPEGRPTQIAKLITFSPRRVWGKSHWGARFVRLPNCQVVETPKLGSLNHDTTA